MEIFIFRHADKDFTSPSDPGLSPHGHKQAQSIAQAVHEKTLVMPKEIWVSPKRRAKETFIPLQELLNLPLFESTLIDQRNYEESSQQFILRAKKFILETVTLQKSGPIFICSHSDWIEALSLVSGLIKGPIDFNTFMMPSAAMLQFKVDADLTWTFINKRKFPS